QLWADLLDRPSVCLKQTMVGCGSVPGRRRHTTIRLLTSIHLDRRPADPDTAGVGGLKFLRRWRGHTNSRNADAIVRTPPQAMNANCSQGELLGAGGAARRRSATPVRAAGCGGAAAGVSVV